jgi:hypothetical protein
MSLKQWADNGWLRKHRTSPEEIDSLLHIVDRDLKDAAEPISPDWRFAIAYNAALKLCTMLLSAEGFRAERNLQHYRTIQALALILGRKRQPDVDYLEACRKKRNVAGYDQAGGISETEAEELISFTGNFREDVLRWLEASHPELLKPRLFVRGFRASLDFQASGPKVSLPVQSVLKYKYSQANPRKTMYILK